MKKLLLMAICAAVMAGCASPKDVREARALAGRVLEGSGVSHIQFRIISAEADTFRIESEGGKVIISGNNANSMATGLGYYLRHYCNISIGWMDEGRARLDAPIPEVTEAVESSANQSGTRYGRKWAFLTSRSAVSSPDRPIFPGTG